MDIRQRQAGVRPEMDIRLVDNDPVSALGIPGGPGLEGQVAPTAGGIGELILVEQTATRQEVLGQRGCLAGQGGNEQDEKEGVGFHGASILPELWEVAVEDVSGLGTIRAIWVEAQGFLEHDFGLGAEVHLEIEQGQVEAGGGCFGRGGQGFFVDDLG